MSDYPADPGCFHPSWFTEDSECQNGVNNEPGQDGWIDFDGGVSAGVPPEWQTDPDSQCTDRWRKRGRRCGLGAESASVLAPVMWMWGQRSRRV
jgi:hypothetical protein